jgi:hypothetical protein
LERLRTGLLHPAMKPCAEGVGGDQTASTGVPSPDAWSSASSPHELGGVPNPPPLQHLTHGQDPEVQQPQL